MGRKVGNGVDVGDTCGGRGRWTSIMRGTGAEAGAEAETEAGRVSQSVSQPVSQPVSWLVVALGRVARAGCPPAHTALLAWAKERGLQLRAG